MVTPDSDKLTFKEHRILCGKSRAEVAIGAGVSVSTVIGAESANYPFRTSYGAALLLTSYLGIELCDVRWLRGLSDEGRPAGSGSSLRLAPPVQEIEMCPAHFIALPATGICDDCS